MTYLELMQALEHRLGNQHLPLNARASSFKNLFESSPVHHELVHRLAQALYHGNACRALGDGVTRERSFAAIGPVRCEALKMTHTDVDAYHLLEDMCHALDDIFGAEATPATLVQKQSAEVIPLTPGRKRR